MSRPGRDGAGAVGAARARDYGEAARFLRHREPALFAAVRMLGVPAYQPHAVAGYAFACWTDDLCDQGAPQVRAERFARWREQVGAALAGEECGQPLARAFVHSARLRELPGHWIEDYLAGAEADLSFTGFAREADYQAYVDRLSWPFTMLTAGLVHVGGGDERYAAAGRALADAWQRLDFLIDLAEDLGEGRLYLPGQSLADHGVTRDDLASGRRTEGVEQLVADLADLAEKALLQADAILEVPAEFRPLSRMALRLARRRLAAVRRAGAGIVEGPVRDSAWGLLALLTAARRPDARERAHDRLAR
ncbi:phytoene/squalene synthase family protein [Kitasatospora sp. DSM 101779]|uniref:phytoene/squalene synthase family protein n=1 Tax=Kitasatospora sp. DSM 101779 TaxID=2853165 RepID=UPI0021D9C339|nr:squalene/phytoene synthase family protein [Kitasatospora sp. DSM 101779]MCU7820584.1 squalene/phytoene synthase family protein [Kitasatospora sp. DSM 101779]